MDDLIESLRFDLGRVIGSEMPDAAIVARIYEGLDDIAARLDDSPPDPDPHLQALANAALVEQLQQAVARAETAEAELVVRTAGRDDWIAAYGSLAVARDELRDQRDEARRVLLALTTLAGTATGRKHPVTLQSWGFLDRALGLDPDVATWEDTAAALRKLAGA